MSSSTSTSSSFSSKKNNQGKHEKINNIINSLEEYMFTDENIKKIHDLNFNQRETHSTDNNKNNNKNNKSKYSSNLETTQNNTKTELFMPAQKDKLFWCFYIILHGFSDYELHHTDYFITEKNFKIGTIEKMRLMKPKLKELKIKMAEIEDELLNQPQITMKSLEVLCLVYEVSLLYVYGRMYSELLYNPQDLTKIKGIIITSNTSISNKEYSVRYMDTDKVTNTVTDTNTAMTANETYMNTIRTTYWKIEHIQKPLKAPSAYAVKDLQEICKKLEIPLVNELGKNKTKQILYQEILSKI
jgi:hypothetical protein